MSRTAIGATAVAASAMALLVLRLAGPSAPPEPTGAAPPAATPPSPRPQPRPGFVVIAHRGNSSEAPENTLAAINEAFALGADMVEVDVHLSRDGVPVVIHDETVDRTTNGTGLVSGMTLAELKALDAGSWVSPRYAGERIPTLGEALQAAKGKGRLLLDLKMGGMGRAVAEVFRALSLPKESGVIGAWTQSQTSDFVKHFPGAQILMTGGAPSRWEPDYFRQQRGRGLAGFEIGDNWSAAFIAGAHVHGMPVYAYTINDKPTMLRLIAMGIDGIETDYPAILVALVRELSGRRE